MPMDIMYWEKNQIWPEKQDLDFGISIGTGARKVPLLSKIGPQSPVKDGCALRMFNAFLERLDGEREWYRFKHSLPQHLRTRFHRLNIPLEKDVSIDEVTSIETLQAESEDFIKKHPSEIISVVDSIFASNFYFDLENMPKYCDDGYHCTGSIFCRLDLSTTGRLKLYERLVKDAGIFLINGRPVVGALSVPQGLPPFRCRIRFRVADLSESLCISIRGVTSKPRLISGLPQSISRLIQSQMLQAPFGRVDHGTTEKALPSIPMKRKHVDHSEQLIIK
jgi:hypothetical protein